jgi:TatA/E family protein of Tat protein translocase
MFDLGIQELIVVFVVALLVFGPKRLPEIAKSMGKGIGELKRALDGVKTQMNAELHEVKDIKALKDLDPISLKNELFKSGELFKLEEEPTPQQKAEQTKVETPAAVKEESESSAGSDKKSYDFSNWPSGKKSGDPEDRSHEEQKPKGLA